MSSASSAGAGSTRLAGSRRRTRSTRGDQNSPLRACENTRGRPGLSQEARSVASLDHKGIVPVYDVGRSPDGLCFVVSKYIQGCSLAERMAQRAVSFTEAARSISEVAEAVHHAHTRGLVHRDIKPANILLDLHDQALLTDFGLAL